MLPRQVSLVVELNRFVGVSSVIAAARRPVAEVAIRCAAIASPESASRGKRRVAAGTRVPRRRLVAVAGFRRVCSPESVEVVRRDEPRQAAEV